MMNNSVSAKISIIMPVYNAMPYLEMAIKSIFAQTYENWELIIVDDGSTDESWEFVNKINYPRVKTFKNAKNMGHSWTCNFAISKAKGEYIAKMDADDISFPDRLMIQYEYLITNPEVDVVGCGLYKIDKNFNLISKNIPPENHNEIVALIKFNKGIFFGPNIHISDGALLGKKQWFDKWHYDVNIFYSQDFDLMFRAKNESRYGNVKEVLYIYRRVGSTSNIKSKFLSIKNKYNTLIRYGFIKSEKINNFFSIISLILRFVVAILTPIILKTKSDIIFKKNNEVNTIIAYIKKNNQFEI